MAEPFRGFWRAPDLYRGGLATGTLTSLERVSDTEAQARRQQVNVTVQDDGVGFDTHFLRGLGILGMKKRVRRLGRRLKISSQPGHEEAW